MTNGNNSGYCNSGCYNSGYKNSGDFNSGDFNSGDSNSGYYNTGYFNVGDYNSGLFNAGCYNSGLFNTNSPDKIRIFNTWVDMSHSEFHRRYREYIMISLPINRWIDSDEMSDEEKKDVSSWEQMGGYLKTLNYKEAWQVWWNENPEKHQNFLNLPAFNADIFKEITGIDINEKVEEMTMEEVCRELGRTIKIKK